MTECAGAASDEHIINRWNLDFYVFKAFGAFRNGDYAAFTHFIDIIESLAVRPVDGQDDTLVKLRFMQFLSRINNGDKLDLTFEEPKTPLESALDVLESLCRHVSVPQREQELVRAAIAEMLVTVCIRSGEFEKAEEMLRHLSTGAHSAGKKKLLAKLIRCRHSSHPVLQLSSYSDFKQDMLDFIDRLYCVPEPFLLQMLKRSRRPGRSSELMTSSQKPNNSTAAEDHGAVCAAPLRLSLHSLRQVYAALSEPYGVSLTFSQLQLDVETEAQQENRQAAGPELRLALSETTERAAHSSRQDKPRDSCYTVMTMSRLVLEDDSQPSEDDTLTRGAPDTQIGHGSHDQTHVQEEVQVSGRSHDQSVVISADSESDDAELQTCPSSPLSVRASESEAQCSQRSTRSRHQSSVTETQNHHSSSESEVECLSVQGPVRRAQTHRRIIVSSGPDSEDQRIRSPPAVRHAPRRKHQQDDSESSDSEQEIHSTFTRAKHRRLDSPPAGCLSGGTHRARRAQWQDVSGTQEQWSDEETLFSSSSGPASKKYMRKMWTVQESEWLKEGVQRFGVGHWERIRSAFPFSGRSAVNLKDRWRTMVKLRLV